MTACLARDLDVSLGGLLLGVCVVALTGAVTSFLSLLDIEFSSHVERTLYLYTHICYNTVNDAQRHLRYKEWRSERMRCFLWAGELRRCVCFLPPGSPLDIDSSHADMHYAGVVSLPAMTFNLGMAGPLDGLLQLRISNDEAEASSARVASPRHWPECRENRGCGCHAPVSLHLLLMLFMPLMNPYS